MLLPLFLDLLAMSWLYDELIPISYKSRKLDSLKTVFNGEKAYITQLKRQKSKRRYELGSMPLKTF